MIALKVSRISELENQVEELIAAGATSAKRIEELEGQINNRESDLTKLRQQKSASVWKKVKVQAKKAEEVHKYSSVPSCSHRADSLFYRKACHSQYFLKRRIV